VNKKKKRKKKKKMKMKMKMKKMIVGKPVLDLITQRHDKPKRL
jgi:hypothetical protein